MTQLRCRTAEERANETTVITGCPCTSIGYVGQDVGEHLLTPTVLLFEWLLVKKTNGEAYTVRVCYHHLIHDGDNIPHCPIRMRGRPGLVYSIQWFEQFAEHIMPGLQFCGLVYEGQAVSMEEVLPSGCGCVGRAGVLAVAEWRNYLLHGAPYASRSPSSRGATRQQRRLRSDWQCSGVYIPWWPLQCHGSPRRPRNFARAEVVTLAVGVAEVVHGCVLVAHQHASWGRW